MNDRRKGDRVHATGWIDGEVELRTRNRNSEARSGIDIV
jgi:hypothetical protein